MSRRTFQTFNPNKNRFNSEVYTCHSEEEANSLLIKSEKAYTLLQKKSNVEIYDLLVVIVDKLRDKKSSIENIYIKETGLSSDRFDSEFQRTINQTLLFAEHIISEEYILNQEFKNTTQNKFLIKKKVGVGPVLIIGASNFPLAYSTIGGDSIAALAAKNPIIVKAHPYHTGTSLLVSKIVIEALDELKFPEGSFTHFINDNYEFAQFLATHKTIKAIGFTGSFQGGQAFMKYGMDRVQPIPVFSEMGSVNPVVILKSLFQKIPGDFAKEIASAVCNDSGQFCTKPGLLFIPKVKGFKTLLSQIKNEILSFEIQPMLHPEILRNFEKKIENLKQAFTIAELIIEKHHKAQQSYYPRKSILITEITALNNQPFLEEEIFGPHLTILLYEDEQELKSQLQTLKGQLTFSIFNAPDHQEEIIKSLTEIGTRMAGRIIFNGLPTGVEVCASMQHGGPYPASSDSRFTAVGPHSIERFQRSVTFQNNRI